ncbi:hypothetical protein THAOC_32071, partial [Thalassiosira oceanica]
RAVPAPSGAAGAGARAAAPPPSRIPPPLAGRARDADGVDVPLVVPGLVRARLVPARERLRPVHGPVVRERVPEPVRDRTGRDGDGGTPRLRRGVAPPSPFSGGSGDGGGGERRGAGPAVRGGTGHGPRGDGGRGPRELREVELVPEELREVGLDALPSGSQDDMMTALAHAEARASASGGVGGMMPGGGGFGGGGGGGGARADPEPSKEELDAEVTRFLNRFRHKGSQGSSHGSGEGRSG